MSNPYIPDNLRHMSSIYLDWYKRRTTPSSMQMQAADEIKSLQQQLAKANERVKELEVELKESEDDLELAQHESSSYENALEDIKSIFVDGDACPFFEPFNPRNLSTWLNKFAIEQKVEALESLMLSSYESRDLGCEVVTVEAFEIELERLRKEQENG